MGPEISSSVNKEVCDERHRNLEEKVKKCELLGTTFNLLALSNLVAVITALVVYLVTKGP